MSSVARRAYGQARARARSAGILTYPELTAMCTAPAVTRVSGWRDLALADDGAATVALAYSRLADDYGVMRRVYPEARDALDALLQLHELENIKLLWRAAVRQAPVEAWRAAWRPLGDLQRIALDRFSAAFSPTAVATALAPTPYGEIAESALRAHGDDVAAAELAFDRFGTQSVAAAHDRLPSVERSARALLRAVITVRDALIAERTRTMIGFASLPLPSRPPVAVLARRILALEPFSLAVPLALVLRREEEVRGLLTLSEMRARHVSGEEACRALRAASCGG